MLFAAFWVGGQAAMVGVLWAEWYTDREFPPSVRMLSPWQLGVAVFFCLGFWPGFIVLMALKRRQLHDENQADQDLADELAERFPETHGAIAGWKLGLSPGPELDELRPVEMLCRLSCGLLRTMGRSGPLCPWCDRYSPAARAHLAEPEQHEEGSPVHAAEVRAGLGERDH